mgnify:CR=1 FL=1
MYRRIDFCIDIGFDLRIDFLDNLCADSRMDSSHNFCFYSVFSVPIPVFFPDNSSSDFCSNSHV